ncbi:hypothetical protein [Tenacibaculum sp. M341]|uniref:hypothetical protein n=1 Tax=Tenacibaculum sp. M341 TaxID=2530339 RepID=UPI00105055E6|nr:hypothetical protein [Tenacibaculum sp. M341]TCI94772.1 hypothetical protein EYW44_00180 [Tenacibaculum sp. M341]
MRKHLYFICPTDCLETVIDSTFKNENYFYTSLGNSVVFNSQTLLQLKQIVRKHLITKVIFVLSDENYIILDALENQKYEYITGLRDFYQEMSTHKKYATVTSSTTNRAFYILSHYLNIKIKELQFEFHQSFLDSVQISAKIYNKQGDTFSDIYPSLVCIDKYCLN